MTGEQRERYARHLNLEGIGEAGQRRLLAARVAIVGVGGLGSPAALYCAAAGIGTLILIDGDRVELSNLQRQVVHRTSTLGLPKVESAKRLLADLNPDAEILPFPVRLDPQNADELLGGCDFVIDATDNFAAKFMIADQCHRLAIPYSHAGIRQFFGQTMTVLPGRSACYRCVFEDAPSDAATPQGPLGVLPGVLGTVQATEAIKHLAGTGQLLTNRLLTYDALAMTFRTIPVRRNPRCTLCADYAV